MVPKIVFKHSKSMERFKEVQNQHLGQLLLLGLSKKWHNKAKNRLLFSVKTASMDFLPIFTNKCHLICFDHDKCVSKLKEDIKSFHLRPITLICDHFEVFYRQKTDQKRTKIGQKILEN